MKKRFASLVIFSFLTIIFVSAQAYASIVLGGNTFDNNAFADKLVSYYGSTWTFWNAPTLEAAMTGSNLNSYGATTNQPSAYAILKFTDNFIKNGPGADLAVYEISGGAGSGEPVSITIGGITNVYLTVSGYIGYANASVALINLDDYGIASGALVNTIQVNGIANWDPDYAVFGAINNVSSVPLPGALFLFGPVLAGLAALRRRFPA